MIRLIAALLFVIGLGVAPAMAADCDGIYGANQFCGSAAGGAPGPIAIPSSAMPAGVDANILNTRTSNYSIATTDCSKTVQLGTGSTGFFTITIPSVSGFSATCSVVIINGDTTNGKAISGLSGVPGNMLWPKQAATVKIINGAWAWTELPGRYVATANVNLNVSTTGCTLTTVPTCDGLAVGTAFALVGTAVNAFLNQIDVAGFSGSVTLADGTYTEQVTCGGKFIGTTEINIQGASGHTGSVLWNVSATGAAVGFFFKDYCAIFLNNMTVTTPTGTIGVTTGLFGNVDIGTGVTFNVTGSTATAIYINKGGYGSAVGGLSLSGTAGNYLVLVQGGVFDWGQSVLTCTSSPAFSTAVMYVAQNGQLYAPSLTTSGCGSVTGLKFKVVLGGTLSTNGVDPNGYFPGDANGVIQQATLDAANPANVPVPAPTTTYASLPTPVAGMYAYISDGKSSNCGDSACTTWGTTVTGGTGALKLFIWYNGSNWTLAGK